MVKKVAQRAIAAGLAGMMSLGAFAPAAMAIDGTTWSTLPWWSLAPTSDDDGLTFFKRIKGDTRYDTMKKILEACYVSGTEGGNRWINAAEAVIASGENFPDALAANGLAGTLNNGKGAPVILTKKDALSSQAKDVLEKMQVQHVYIMGGTNTISQEVEDAIAKLKIATTRVAGVDRQETSMKAFDLVSGNWYKNYGTHSVIIATGATYADSLSIAPFAYQTGTPIVLTQADGTLTQAQIDSIKDNKEIYNIIVVGGEKSVNPSAFSLVGSYNDRYGFNYTGVRIDGDDRYATSANIADWEVNYAKGAYNRIIGKDQGGSTYALNVDPLGVTNIGDCYFDWDFTFVATGEKFPDALAGAQLAGGSYLNARGNGYISHTNKQGDKEGFISGSPILLTKEGDRTAEMVIARNLAWNTDTYYRKAHAVYANFLDLNLAKGTTPGDFITNYLANGFFSMGPITSGVSNTTGLSTNGLGQVESEWLSQIVRRNSDNQDLGVVFWNINSGTWVIVDFNGNEIGTAGNGWTPNTTASIGGSNVAVSYINSLPRVVQDNATGEVYGILANPGAETAADPTTTTDVVLFGKTIGTWSQANGFRKGGTAIATTLRWGNYIYGDDVFGIGSPNVVAGNQHVVTTIGTGTYNAGIVTIDGKNYRLAVNSPEFNDNSGQKAIVSTASNIYVLDRTVGADSNFHGIIFGGTASVSKKKAEDLDKAVKNSILSDKTYAEWAAGDDYNTVLNRTLLGNQFYGYVAGMPVTSKDLPLTDYYMPVGFNLLADLSTGIVWNDASHFKGYWAVDTATVPNQGKIYKSVSAANADGYVVEGAVYTVDFYHYAYGFDPSLAVKVSTGAVRDWYYDGTVSVDFVVNENTGEIIQLPQFK